MGTKKWPNPAGAPAREQYDIQGMRSVITRERVLDLTRIVLSE